MSIEINNKRADHITHILTVRKDNGDKAEYMYDAKTNTYYDMGMNAVDFSAREYDEDSYKCVTLIKYVQSMAFGSHK